jgi:hypothetical protein
MPYTSEETIMADMKQCIQNCTNCHNICVQTTAYCIQMSGRHAEANHLESLLDCADTCRVSADFMLRNSALHPMVCGVCAEACERCAQSCSEFGDDAQMLVCAEECRRCAESCREMARMKM